MGGRGNWSLPTVVSMTVGWNGKVALIDSRKAFLLMQSWPEWIQSQHFV